MTKYLMNDESTTTFLSLSEKCKELEHTHYTLKEHAQAAMKKAGRAQESADEASSYAEQAQSNADEASSYAEDAHSSASSVDDSCDEAERALCALMQALDDIQITPYESETELEKVLKLTGLSIFNLKRILKDAPEEEESVRQFVTS